MLGRIGSRPFLGMLAGAVTDADVYTWPGVRMGAILRELQVGLVVMITLSLS